jgi:ketosteroid isomerase-like protein
MPELPNVEIVRRGYAAFNNGDTSALAALIAENVVWHVPGRSLIAGDWPGNDLRLPPSPPPPDHASSAISKLATRLRL